MIQVERINDTIVKYYSDLGLKIERISTGQVYNIVMNKPGLESEYREVKEFIEAKPAYAEEAILYKTLLDTVSGETQGDV